MQRKRLEVGKLEVADVKRAEDDFGPVEVQNSDEGGVVLLPSVT